MRHNLVFLFSHSMGVCLFVCLLFMSFFLWYRIVFLFYLLQGEEGSGKYFPLSSSLERRVVESTFHYPPLWRGRTCISVSIQVHLYPQLKREICNFWKSSIAPAKNWTQYILHWGWVPYPLLHRGSVKDGMSKRQNVYAAIASR